MTRLRSVVQSDSRFPDGKIPAWAQPLAEGRSRQIALETDVLRGLLSQSQNRRPGVGLGSLGDMMGLDLVCLPTTAPAVQNFTFPLTLAQYQELFGNKYFFLDFQALQNTGTRSNAWSQSATVDEPILVRGVGLVMRYSVMSFSMPGAYVPNTSGTPNTPIVRTYLPVPITGLLDAVGTSGPAVYEYGGPVWAAVVYLLTNFNLLYVVNNRLALVNQRAIDVGVIEAMSGFRGYGTGQVNPMPYIERFNAHLKDIGLNIAFSPPNTSGSGSSAVALPPPVVDTQWGGPFMPGAYGSCGSFPVTAHMLLPGQNYQIFLENQGNDTVWGQLLQDEMIATTTMSRPLDGYQDTRAASTVSGSEQPAVWAGAVPFKGGELQFGMTLKGATLMPAAALAWYLTWGAPSLANYGDQMDSFARMQELAQRCRLSGVARPFSGIDDPRIKNNGRALAGIKDAKSPLDMEEALRVLWNDAGKDGEHHFTDASMRTFCASRAILG